MTKKVFKYFTVFNHEKEENYLREMHKLGWRLNKVTGIGMYHFEQCQPEDVIYQLDYNDEKDINKKAEYIKMYNDCGWEYLYDYAGYSYFRKPVAQMNGEERIFSDDDSKLQMLKRVFKGRIAIMIFLLLLMILNLYLAFNRVESVGELEGLDYLSITAYGFAAVVYIIGLSVFAAKYFKFKNGMK